MTEAPRRQCAVGLLTWQDHAWQLSSRRCSAWQTHRRGQRQPLLDMSLLIVSLYGVCHKRAHVTQLSILQVPRLTRRHWQSRSKTPLRLLCSLKCRVAHCQSRYAWAVVLHAVIWLQCSMRPRIHAMSSGAAVCASVCIASSICLGSHDVSSSSYEA